MSCSENSSGKTSVSFWSRSGTSFPTACRHISSADLLICWAKPIFGGMPFQAKDYHGWPAGADVHVDTGFRWQVESCPGLEAVDSSGSFCQELCQGYTCCSFMHAQVSKVYLKSPKKISSFIGSAPLNACKYRKENWMFPPNLLIWVISSNETD